MDSRDWVTALGRPSEWPIPALSVTPPGSSTGPHDALGTHPGGRVEGHGARNHEVVACVGEA
jgi:hypothetical protein